MSTVIHINRVHHQFGENTVINDFELNIDKGEIITFIGKSGCGKSTLLNIIGGFLTPHLVLLISMVKLNKRHLQIV